MTTADQQKELITQIEALLEINATGAVSHGVPGLAVELLRRSVAALSQSNQPTHRHKKRGSEYVLLGYGKMQAEQWFEEKWQHSEQSGEPPLRTLNTVDMREVAIYCNVDDGSLWARPREEFEDGRFESLISFVPTADCKEL